MALPIFVANFARQWAIGQAQSAAGTRPELTIKITSNFDAVLKGIKDDQRAIERATQRALNVAARGMRTDTSSVLRERYRLKKRDVDQKISVTLATTSSLRATVTIKDSPLSVARFLVGQNTKPGGGAIVNIKGDRKVISHTFVQKLKSGGGDDYNVVFARTGKERYPLVAIRTIDVASASNIDAVRVRVGTMTDDRFDKEFARQMNLHARSIPAQPDMTGAKTVVFAVLKA